MEIFGFVFFYQRCIQGTFVYFIFRRALERILGNPVELDAKQLDAASVGIPSFGFMGAGGAPTVDALAGKKPSNIKKCKGKYCDAAVEQYWRFRKKYGQRIQRRAEERLGYRGLFLTGRNRMFFSKVGVIVGLAFFLLFTL